MSGLPQRYNPRFIQYWRDNGGRPDLQTLGDYGISIMRHSSPAAFRVIGIHHLSGQENGGKHHIFVDVLDEDGQRLNGSTLQVMPEGGAPAYAKIDKPAVEPGTNAPMWASQTYRLQVAYHDSDTILGLSTGHPDEPGGGNTWGHHSFYVVFQRGRVAQPEPPVDPKPPVAEPPEDDTEALLRQIKQAFIELRQSVETVAADVVTIKNTQRAEVEIRRQVAAVIQR